MNKEMLSDLHKDLEREMNKPIKKRDTERITKLNEMIFALTDVDNETVRNSIESSKNELLNKLSDPAKPNHIKLYKRFSVVAACLLIIFGANMFSLKVFGQNMFSAEYKLSKGGITINTTQSKDSVNIFESDPYGMKAKCAEYGFFPDTPDYIPDGFTLIDMSEHSDEASDYLAFHYKKGNIKLKFGFTHYKGNDEIASILIPTDTYNITEEEIKGLTVYILKEDSQFTAVYVNKKIEYNIFAEGLDYDECQKILESLS